MQFEAVPLDHTCGLTSLFYYTQQHNRGIRVHTLLTCSCDELAADLLLLPNINMQYTMKTKYKQHNKGIRVHTLLTCSCDELAAGLQ